MLRDEKHNITSLAGRYRVGKRKVKSLLQTFLDDPEQKKQFGAYAGRTFTPRQLELISDAWGEPPSRD